MGHRPAPAVQHKDDAGRHRQNLPPVLHQVPQAQNHRGNAQLQQLGLQLHGQVGEVQPPPHRFPVEAGDQNRRPVLLAPGGAGGGIIELFGRINNTQPGGAADLPLPCVVEGVGHRGQRTAAYLGNLAHGHFFLSHKTSPSGHINDHHIRKPLG